ncbi:SDR family NAD(P)-dependent oxidoreductase [Aeromicrobium sp. 636]|uniref:SDR family NAD(P)-dependent oxidoreductase n=1 Tax=Aeromicrobium senzhongii TaxID=2663859 RepID=A0A8I0EU10_9ACTN|nr:MULTISPECIES: SDR family NAD(P)-dependent oxidoreductase [Aeromicrobium]MBC9226094.1 SDR family NAD(P)-dependent oxidoreductase [Aeromicrobium senzhongii]MCQ3998201.1 SDR family NAD(P)-dependent oxidoreductase [Aeromicrobium sp. 636]MTB88629.1 SDR family NAD(P)-dependent oxidoreductase [Aeromicrobium senzhongii]QNL94066.1 SDR family NAD(P)-dependent oxidoreductase [Aeromicrobium senzhongii]
MPTAVVTGASSGIGEATARALSAAGYTVFAVARRRERIERLAEEIGATAVPCDITAPDDVARLVEVVGDRLDLLVNNAGGAKGMSPVTEADLADWRWMYETNVLGTVAVTQALAPALIASGAGTIINVGSTAGHITYEGGGGYTAAKHALAAVTETLRLELNGQPVRITEIAPGMVKTEEFSLTRFDGDQERADAVYAGVDEPLVAQDIADAICWVATRPAHVDIDLMVIKPVAQAAQWKVHRRPT